MKARPTTPAIIALRRQLRKNQLACLMLAQGTPLMLAGDEVGNSQSGNNNAYCQDNEIGWVGWDNLGKEGDDLTDFIGHLTELRRRFGQIRCQRWLDGRRADGSYGVLWLTPAAEEMTESDWNFPEGRFLAYVLGPMEQGQAPIFIVLNAAPEEIAFQIAQDARIQELAAGAEHRRSRAGHAPTSPRAPRPRRRRARCWPLRARHECAAVRPEADAKTARSFGCGRRRQNASTCCWNSRTR